MRSIRQLLFSPLVFLSCIGQVNTFVVERSGRCIDPKDIRYEKNGCRLFSRDDDSEMTTAKVRFSGIPVDASDNMDATTNPIDYALSWITSDVGSIALGILGLLLLLVGRLILIDNSSDIESLGQETRVNLLAVLATGAVLVNGVSKLDVESALAETVTLQGIELSEPMILVDDESMKHDDQIQWTLESLLSATPAKTAVLLNTSTRKIVAMAGIVPSADPPLNNNTPILDRCSKKTMSETYLPTLQALPGRTEFTYLPVNTQAVLLLPAVVGNDVVLVLGSNQARSFTPRNIAWCQTVATRLGTQI